MAFILQKHFFFRLLSNSILILAMKTVEISGLTVCFLHIICLYISVIFPQACSGSVSSALCLLCPVMLLNGVGGGLGYHRLKSQHFGCACAVPPICCIFLVCVQLRQASRRYHLKYRRLGHIQYEASLLTLNVQLYSSDTAHNNSNVFLSNT